MIQSCNYTIPKVTVALKLTSLPADGTGVIKIGPTSEYSSVINELDFHPQLWLTENTSGAELNRVKEEPVAPAHDIVKYREMGDRGSR
jgi:hypothetical protein